jgi:MazG family protein
MKAKERNENASAHSTERSLLDGVPKTLPALAQAEAYGRRAARVGFDWPNPQGVVDKVGEEIQEVIDASDSQERAAEFGDLLFAVVNWARWQDIDPEAALRQANRRFARRFSWIESEARRQQLDLAGLGIDQLEELWQDAKRTIGD